MSTHRYGVVGMLMIAAVGLAVTGCGGASAGRAAHAASPSPSVAAPKDALTAAITQLGRTSYAFTVKQTAVTGQGKVDPAGKAAQMSMTVDASGTAIKLSMVVINTDTWCQMDLGPMINKQAGIDPTAWLRLDTSKITKSGSLPVDPTSADLLDFASISTALVDTRRVDATHYRGTLDLTSVTGVAAPDDDAVSKAGDKAKSVPFSAALDSSGRLADLAIDGSAIDPDLSVDVTFSAYGATQNITKPAHAVPAPSGLYDIFNS